MKAGVGELNQFFGVVVLAVGGFDQFTAEEIVEGRKAAGLRMAYIAALGGGEAERRQLRGLIAHADVRVDENVRPVGEDGLPPAFGRGGALHKAVAKLPRQRGFRILAAAEVVA